MGNLMWKHSGGEATAQGVKYGYRVFESERGYRWAAIPPGFSHPYAGAVAPNIWAALDEAEEFAEKHNDFPRLLVTRNDGERVVVEMNPDPGNMATRVEVELFIHHTGSGVVVDIDYSSAAVIDVDLTSETAMIVRDGELVRWT